MSSNPVARAVAPRLVETADATVTAERTLTESQVEAVAAERARQAVEDATTGHENALAELVRARETAEATAATEAARADAAEQALADYKAGIEAEKERAALEKSRTAEVAAAAPGLPKSFFTPERARRWSTLGQEEFAATLADLTEVAGAAGGDGDGDGEESQEETDTSGGDGDPGRETAMSRKNTAKGASLRSFLDGEVR